MALPAGQARKLCNEIIPIPRVDKKGLVLNDEVCEDKKRREEGVSGTSSTSNCFYYFLFLSLFCSLS